MNIVGDMQALQRVQRAQSGVLSRSDLQSLLAETHAAAFTRRVGNLEASGALRRFIRGWYVTPDAFSPLVLSQRIAPESYISATTVLARALVVGVAPDRQVWAVKVGRSRTYENDGCTLVHMGVQPSLYFGFTRTADGAWASPEKALLDALHLYMHGTRLPFDIYSDLNVRLLDRVVLARHLARYANPKFRTFVAGVLDANA